MDYTDPTQLIDTVTAIAKIAGALAVLWILRPILVPIVTQHPVAVAVAGVAGWAIWTDPWMTAFAVAAGGATVIAVAAFARRGPVSACPCCRRTAANPAFGA